MSNYPTAIHRLVALAQAGTYPNAIIRLKSGWVAMAERQSVEGYCLLFSDPVARDLNSLNELARTQYCLDMARVGDALLAVTGALRINYETWGNLDPALHTHIVPRYAHEPPEQRVMPICKAYDAKLARPFDAQGDREFIERMRAFLSPYA